MFQFLDELLFISKLILRTHLSMFETLLNITMSYLERFVLNASFINSCCQCRLIKSFASITILVLQFQDEHDSTDTCPTTQVSNLTIFYTPKTRGRRIITVNVLHLAVYSNQRFWRNAASAKSSTSLSTMHIHVCIRIDTFRKTLIQIYVNLSKN